MISNSCISWLSKKPPRVATWSCGVEYRAAFSGTVECVRLRRLLSDLSLEQPSPTCIFTDSQSVLAIARDPIFHLCTKHIEVHYCYVREPFQSMYQLMKMLQTFLRRLYPKKSFNIFTTDWAFFQHLDSDDVQVHIFHLEEGLLHLMCILWKFWCEHS